ncbi:hypothetical protein F5887DRAFT_1072672 [Amanita rubescens]|nr:hypothetical protein F5887DRAFT_1072672 [Amanita rubescens]
MSNSCEDENARPGNPSSRGHGKASSSLTHHRRCTASSLDTGIGRGRGYIPISARATITGGRRTFGPLNTPPSSLNSPHATKPPVITPSASHTRPHAPSNLQQPKNYNIVNRNSVYEENNPPEPILYPNHRRRQEVGSSGFQMSSNSTGTSSNAPTSARRQNRITQARPSTDPQRPVGNAGTRRQTPLGNDSDGDPAADENHDEDEPPAADEHPVDDERVKEYMVRLNHQRELLRTAASEGEDGPTAAESLDTWAKRLPTAVVQPIRSRVYRPRTHAERQTIKMRSAQIKENGEALLAEVKAFHVLRDKLVEELAEKFRKKEDYIRVLLCSSSTLKSTRKPNLKNAILHKKAKELNEGRCNEPIPATLEPISEAFRSSPKHSEPMLDPGG